MSNSAELSAWEARHTAFRPHAQSASVSTAPLQTVRSLLNTCTLVEYKYSYLEAMIDSVHYSKTVILVAREPVQHRADLAGAFVSVPHMSGAYCNGMCVRFTSPEAANSFKSFIVVSAGVSVEIDLSVVPHARIGALVQVTLDEVFQCGPQYELVLPRSKSVVAVILDMCVAVAEVDSELAQAAANLRPEYLPLVFGKTVVGSDIAQITGMNVQSAEIVCRDARQIEWLLRGAIMRHRNDLIEHFLPRVNVQVADKLLELAIQSGAGVQVIKAIAKVCLLN